LWNRNRNHRNGNGFAVCTARNCQTIYSTITTGPSESRAGDYIEGRLKTRKWQDKETSADRYSTEIVADQMQILGGREGSQAAGDDAGQDGPKTTSKPAQPRKRGGRSAAPAAQPAANDQDDDMDIPF